MNDSKKRRFRDRQTGPVTLINEGCKITGVLSGVCDFMISGEVEGDSDLKARTVTVAGRVEGDIQASGHVEIADSARITGTVTGEAIAVAAGAVVEGTMKTTGRSEPLEYVEKRQHEETA